MLIQYYYAAMIRVEKAAVLGAGTMGAQIAAHLANAQIPTLLLDIVPRDESQPADAKTGALADGRASAPAQVSGATQVGAPPQVSGAAQDRNRIARAGFEAARKAKPAAFFTADLAALVTVGNFEDDLAKLKDVDLIIEAVVENPDIKRSLYEKVEQHRRP